MPSVDFCDWSRPCVEHINVPVAHMAVGHCADTCWHLSGTASERKEGRKEGFACSLPRLLFAPLVTVAAVVFGKTSNCP